MWIVKNRLRMRPGRPFYSRLVLETEADSKSCSTSLLVIFASTSSSKFLMTLSNVPK